jgi:hypothetical protein
MKQTLNEQLSRIKEMMNAATPLINEQWSEKEKKQLDTCFKKNSQYFSKIASATGSKWYEPYGEGSFLGYENRMNREFSEEKGKIKDKNRFNLGINTDACEVISVNMEILRMGYGGEYHLGPILKSLQSTVKSSGLPFKCTSGPDEKGNCTAYTYKGKPGDPNVFKVIDIYKKFNR